MNSDGTRRWWQFSLRSFLLAALLIGAFVGFAGPILLESITVWQPPPHPMSPPRPRSAPAAGERDGYYESGETPLY